MTDKKSDSRSRGDSRQATTPIPVYAAKDGNVTTARDFNVTGGQERSERQSDQTTNAGTTDIGAQPSKFRTGGDQGQPSSVTGGTKVVTDSGTDLSGTEGESPVATSDAGTPAILTEDSKGTSAASGAESKPTSESKGTSARSRTKKPKSAKKSRKKQGKDEEDKLKMIEMD